MKTPQQSYPSLRDTLGLTNDVYLKREDLHPYGSHKGRSIPLMIKASVRQHGIRHFVISSSGNAALAAIRGVARYLLNNPDTQLTLRVFIGERIPATKKERLEKEIAQLDPRQQEAITLTQCPRPKQAAMQAQAQDHTHFLRQSTDDLALDGYITLADELARIPNLGAVFVPTSSGTTAQAVATRLAQHAPQVQVHIVQTTACFPIAKALNTTAAATESSVAGAIVDRVAHRRQHVAAAVAATGGSAWIPDDDMILKAQALLTKTTDISVSENGALALAGLEAARASGWQTDGAIALLICGI